MQKLRKLLNTLNNFAKSLNLICRLVHKRPHQTSQNMYITKKKAVVIIKIEKPYHILIVFSQIILEALYEEVTKRA